MRTMTSFAFAAAGLAAVAQAQTAAPSGAIVAVERPTVPANGSAVLPTNTELLLSLNSEVNSKTAKVGDRFPLTVVSDVMLGNYIVIPKGTRGTGEVTYRTGKGAFGKSAKMEIDLRSIELGGRSIPITGHYRQEGQGNTGATVGTAVAAGPFAAFVTGRSAIFTQGRELRAFTREAIPVTLSSAR